MTISQLGQSGLTNIKYIQKSNRKIDFVIEKSPPNMMRIVELSTHFKRLSLIANNRNPYANCASILYRNFDAESFNLQERKEILLGLAGDWIK